MRFELSVSDGEYKVERVEPTIVGAQKVIMSSVFSRATQIYGVSIPERVFKRIDYERNLMAATYSFDLYLIHRELIRLSGLKRGLYSYRGCTANSLIAYLIGLSEFNPIEGDFQLPPEIIFGISKRRKPQLDINVPSSKVTKVREILDKLPGVGDTIREGREWGIHPCKMLLIPDGFGKAYEWFQITENEEGTEYALVDAPYAGDVVLGINVIGDEYLDMLAFCENETHFPVADISLSDDDTMLGVTDTDSYVLWDDVFRIMPEYSIRMKHLMKVCAPKDFMELVRAVGIVYSIEEVYSDIINRIECGVEGLSDAVSTFEDCFEIILKSGIGRGKALYYADRICCGKAGEVVEDMLCDGMPADFIGRFEKMRYISYRGHMMQLALKYWRLAYYMVHFPDVYMSAVEYCLSDLPEE